MLLKQRFIIYLLAIYFGLVLFNTTYLGLGTYIPLIIMILGLMTILIGRSYRFEHFKLYYIMMGLIILISSLFSDADNFRNVFKILLTIIFFCFASSLKTTTREIRFLSLSICCTYVIYVFLMIEAIGTDVVNYGRIDIRLFGGEIPIDTNVISAVYVLPFIISLYNLLYGQYKLLACCFIFFFIIGVLLSGSHGAAFSIGCSSICLLIPYLHSKKSSKFFKIISLGLVGLALYYGFSYISLQEDVMGAERIFDFNGDVSNGRIDIWEERLSLFLDSPLLGYGYNYNIGINHYGTANHNLLLQILLFSGMIGLILFVIPTLKIFQKHSVSISLKLALFISVFMPLFFIDSLEERTLWNFLIFYCLLSSHNNANRYLLWNK